MNPFDNFIELFLENRDYLESLINKNPEKMAPLLILSENKHVMSPFLTFPEETKEYIKENWDELTKDESFCKLGVEDWRPCRDRGPLKNAIYCFRQLPSAEKSSKMERIPVKNGKIGDSRFHWTDFGGFLTEDDGKIYSNFVGYVYEDRPFTPGFVLLFDENTKMPLTPKEICIMLK